MSTYEDDFVALDFAHFQARQIGNITVVLVPELMPKIVLPVSMGRRQWQERSHA